VQRTGIEIKFILKKSLEARKIYAGFFIMRRAQFC